MSAEPKPYAKTEQVLTTLTPDDRRRLDEFAEGRMSRASAVRKFILDGLAHEEERERQIAAAPPPGATPDR